MRSWLTNDCGDGNPNLNVSNIKMTSSEPIDTLDSGGEKSNSEKPCLRRENGDNLETDLSKMVQQKPRVASFQVGWVQVIEELQWKLNTVSYKGYYSYLSTDVLTFMFE